MKIVNLFIIFAVMVFFIPISVQAQFNANIDGINYCLYEDQTARVTSSPMNDQYSGDIIIPSSVIYEKKEYLVVRIEDEAFYRSSSLNSVSLPSGLLSIGKNAFSGSNISKISFPNSLSSIEKFAFDGCYQLSSIYIPSSITNIEKFAFTYCPKLQSIVVEPSNPKYDSRENCNAIIEKATNTLLYGCANTQIPNSIKSIGEEAFSGCFNLQYISIPNSVLSIGKRSFIYCTGLTNVSMSDNITSIGYEAFFDCENLAQLEFPTALISIEEGAFSNCRSLKNINISKQVSNIGRDAFEYCTSLRSIKIEEGNTYYDSRENCNAIIETQTNTLLWGCSNTTIPNSVAKIGDKAFWGCPELKCIILPNVLNEIGKDAFRECIKLKSIVVEEGNPYYDSRENCNAIIETKTNTLICGCLGTVIPNTVKKIGKNAFDGCKNLSIITIPNSVTEIGSCAFRDCKNLQTISMPNYLTSLGSSAFSGCSSLLSIIIPNGVTKIEDCLFQFCNSLTNATLPNSITSIEWAAFECCNNLLGIFLPNSIKSIGLNAFQQCSSLKSINIPNSMTTIDQHVFWGCYELKDIYIQIEDPRQIEVKGDIFTKHGTLHVLPGCKEKYQKYDPWRKFYIIEDAENDIKTIELPNNEDIYYNLQGQNVKNITPNTLLLKNKKKIILR